MTGQLKLRCARGRWLAAIGIAVFLATLVGRAQAWVQDTNDFGSPVRWESSRAVLSLGLGDGSMTSSLPGFASANAVAGRAALQWSGATTFDLSVESRGDLRPCVRGDGRNTVAWGFENCNGAFGPEVVAFAHWYSQNDAIVEAEVVFNLGRSWAAYDGPIQYSNGNAIADLHRVAVHEFGHVIGLDHPDEHGQSVDAIMNSQIDDTDRVRPDDIAGVNAIYGRDPACGVWNDLGEITLPGDFFQAPATSISQRVQVSPDGEQVLVSKDVATERWAISRNEADATATGNIFQTSSTEPQFVYCRPSSGGGSLRCSGSTACRIGARGIVRTPDGQRILVNKDVAGQRWAISKNIESKTLTGNVFLTATAAAAFVFCSSIGEGRYRCSGADPCTAGNCSEQWRHIADVSLDCEFFDDCRANQPPVVVSAEVPSPVRCGPVGQPMETVFPMFVMDPDSSIVAIEARFVAATDGDWGPGGRSTFDLPASSVPVPINVGFNCQAVCGFAASVTYEYVLFDSLGAVSGPFSVTFDVRGPC